MMIKKIFVSLMTLVIFTACGRAPVPATPTVTSIPTLLPTQQPAAATVTALPSMTATATPGGYPTASVVQANAVAFISGNALWTANVDGSGERKLTDFAENTSVVHLGYLTKWSPDGKWISYFSANELWVISPYSLEKKKVLSQGSVLLRYVWSPDGSKIAYKDFSFHGTQMTPTPDPESGNTSTVIGIIDLATGKETEILSYLPGGYEPFFSWLPNGQELLLSSNDTFYFFDTNTMQFVKQIRPDVAQNSCVPSMADSWFRSWAPNGQWFTLSGHGNGYYSAWACINSLDGKVSYEINNVQGVYGIPPAWDKIGDYLYLVVRNYDQPAHPEINPDLRLVRFNVKTKQVQRLLSLPYHREDFLWHVSISPDGHTLAVNSKTSKGQQFYFLNLATSTKTKYEISELQDPSTSRSEAHWSADNRSILFLSKTKNYFYKLDSQTGEVTVISGERPVEFWQISPVASFP